jgi:hypothetical protein
MNDPSFNLAQVAIRPNWYDHLDAVEGAMAECARVEALRYAAGWEADEGGWYSPDGIHESDWEAEGHPLPEDADFANWFRAAYHYEALDAGVEPDPYPTALATA